MEVEAHKPETTPSYSGLAAQADYFARVGLWPSGAESLDLDGWLGNFSEGRDSEIARALLGSFLYFSDQMTTKLFLSAFHSISGHIEDIGDSALHDGSKWNHFLNQKAIVSYPTGNFIESLGSGPKFATIIRDNTSIPENRIMSPERLVRFLYSNKNAVSLIFVDDFAGSGTQFIDTWHREVEIGAYEIRASLKSLFEEGEGWDVHYVSAVCAESAMGRIKHKIPEVVVSAGCVLGTEHSVISVSSEIIPAEHRPFLRDFLIHYAQAAGFNASESFGFGDGGYAIGFASHIPDNTLPIFRQGKVSTWRSLTRRY